MARVWLSVLRGIDLFISVISFAIVLQAILSWFVNPMSQVSSFLRRLTDPFVNPFRKLSARLVRNLPVDFSPVFALLALQLISMIIGAVGARLAASVTLF